MTVNGYGKAVTEDLKMLDKVLVLASTYIIMHFNDYRLNNLYFNFFLFVSPRYEVFEGRPPPHRPGGFRPPPDYDRPTRPIGIHQEPGFPDRPYPDRPGLGPLFVPNER